MASRALHVLWLVEVAAPFSAACYRWNPTRAVTTTTLTTITREMKTTARKVKLSSSSEQLLFRQFSCWISLQKYLDKTVCIYSSGRLGKMILFWLIFRCVGSFLHVKVGLEICDLCGFPLGRKSSNFRFDFHSFNCLTNWMIFFYNVVYLFILVYAMYWLFFVTFSWFTLIFS